MLHNMLLQELEKLRHLHPIYKLLMNRRLEYPTSSPPLYFGVQVFPVFVNIVAVQLPGAVVDEGLAAYSSWYCCRWRSK